MRAHACTKWLFFRWISDHAIWRNGAPLNAERGAPFVRSSVRPFARARRRRFAVQSRQRQVRAEVAAYVVGIGQVVERSSESRHTPTHHPANHHNSFNFP